MIGSCWIMKEMGRLGVAGHHRKSDGLNLGLIECVQQKSIGFWFILKGSLESSEEKMGNL